MRPRALLAALLLLACGACSAGPGGSAASPSTSSSLTVAIVPSTKGVVSVGLGPVGLAADATGAVWVAEAGASKVSRIRSGAVDLSVGGVDTPLRLTTLGDSVWVTSFGTGELVRIATGSGALQGRVAVGKGAEGVAAGFGSLWVVAQDAGKLVRVDPATMTVAGTVDIGVGARLVTASPDAIWVSHFQNGTLIRVDPTTLAPTTSPKLCNGPQGVAYAADAIWVACTTDNVLLKVDPASFAEVNRIPVPGAPDGMAAAPNGKLYVVAQQGPRLEAIDPRSATVGLNGVLSTAPQLYDQANVDVVATRDVVWVSSFSENTVRRVPPV